MTFLDEALLLLPDDQSLSSVSTGMTPATTPVYDIVLTGRCRSGGKTLATLEALVLAPPGKEPITVAGIRGRYAEDEDVRSPFGSQWEQP